jgi:hypothetical protein
MEPATLPRQLAVNVTLASKHFLVHSQYLQQERKPGRLGCHSIFIVFGSFQLFCTRALLGYTLLFLTPPPCEYLLLSISRF